MLKFAVGYMKTKFRIVICKKACEDQDPLYSPIRSNDFYILYGNQSMFLLSLRLGLICMIDESERLVKV